MRTGLRTEIILSILLLLAAALLFAGFLLVKLTEHNMLEQQRAHATDVIMLVAAAVEEPNQATGVVGDLKMTAGGIDRLQSVLGKQADVISWRLLDVDLQVLSSTAYRATGEFQAIDPALLQKDMVVETLIYDSFNLFRFSSNENYLDLSTPVWRGDDVFGLLQIRFGLEGLQQRVQGAQQLILICVVVYGLVLAGFGVYLLNRNVVRPVRLLQEATTSVASGSLTSVNVKSGPGEIHELADSFNQMIDALTDSRAETEAHIATLEETNTALQKARDDLVRSEKLATVGHLAAGMAHEIGNPLGAVIGYLNILKSDLKEGSLDLVERSLAETERIDRLVRELLEYSAPVERQSESFCPITLLRETIDMLCHQGQLDHVHVQDSCDIDECLVSMDRGRLMQVWINLLLNARDAMPDGGKIKLSAHMDKTFISISIQDEGEGIDGSALKQVFEPFFTTKDPGKGYGLGLAVCQRIIDEGGGNIGVSSKKGEGCCFTVVLPCCMEGTE